MKIVSFELTMPNKASWNGKWSGENDKHYIIKKFPDKCTFDFLKSLPDSWYHNFGDGWGANISAEIIDAKEATKRRKLSKGFSGYDWMVNSIVYENTIIYKKIYERF